MPSTRSIRFLEYLAAILVIITLGFKTHLILLAPPYAATSWLVLIERESKFSAKSNVAYSYLFVITSSELLHLIMGSSFTALAINVVITSIFMELTGKIHPPAAALTVFSYLRFNDILFVYSSLFALTLVLMLAFVDERFIARRIMGANGNLQISK